MGFINVDARGDEGKEEVKKQWDDCVIRSGEREIREQDEGGRGPKGDGVIGMCARWRGISLFYLF